MSQEIPDVKTVSVSFVNRDAKIEITSIDSSRVITYQFVQGIWFQMPEGRPISEQELNVVIDLYRLMT
jgi:hypothetical protein